VRITPLAGMAALLAAAAAAGCSPSSPAPQATVTATAPAASPGTAPPQTSSPRIAFKCIVGRYGGASGLLPGPATGRYLHEGAYRVTAYNRNSFPVTVSRITIVYYGPDGQEAGSDDRGFGDGGYSFNGQTITAGQSLTDTGHTRVPPGSFFCKVVAWH
jgi:hypothetical protein